MKTEIEYIFVYIRIYSCVINVGCAQSGCGFAMSQAINWNGDHLKDQTLFRHTTNSGNKKKGPQYTKIISYESTYCIKVKI